MQYICKKCGKVEEVTSYTNRMAIEDSWCESCWYDEHWRPYTLWIGSKGFPIEGYATIDPPDYTSIWHDSIEEKDYTKTDWLGRPIIHTIPERHDHLPCQDMRDLAIDLSQEYNAMVIVQGARPEEKDTIFMIAFNGQLFVPEEEAGND